MATGNKYRKLREICTFFGNASGQNQTVHCTLGPRSTRSWLSIIDCYDDALTIWLL